MSTKSVDLKCLGTQRDVMPIHTRTCEDRAIHINHCTRGCAPEWTVDGTKVHACTNKTMRPEDIIK